MIDSFEFDAFLSYARQDEPVVCRLAEKLLHDGIWVWFDQWEILPGADVAERTESGLERSRILVPCLSANATREDWAHLEADSLRFRDPLNEGRHVIPVLLDDAPVSGWWAQFHSIEWFADDREREYARLLDICKAAVSADLTTAQERLAQVAESSHEFNYVASVNRFAFSPSGGHALTASGDQTVRLWDLSDGRCVWILGEHSKAVLCVTWSDDERYALSGSVDCSLRLWDLEMGRCVRVFAGHTGHVRSVAFSPDGRYAVSGSTERSRQ